MSWRSRSSNASRISGWFPGTPSTSASRRSAVATASFALSTTASANSCLMSLDLLREASRAAFSPAVSSRDSGVSGCFLSLVMSPPDSRGTDDGLRRGGGASFREAQLLGGPTENQGLEHSGLELRGELSVGARLAEHGEHQRRARGVHREPSALPALVRLREASRVHHAVRKEIGDALARGRARSKRARQRGALRAGPEERLPQRRLLGPRRRQRVQRGALRPELLPLWMRHEGLTERRADAHANPRNGMHAIESAQEHVRRREVQE